MAALVDYTDSEHSSDDDDDDIVNTDTATDNNKQTTHPSKKTESSSPPQANKTQKTTSTSTLKRPLKATDDTLDVQYEHHSQPPQKKRKKMKALPSVSNALHAPQHSALQVVNTEHEKEKQKEAKLQELMSSHHAHKTADNNNTIDTDTQHIEGQNKRQQELQHNKREHAKYVKQQMQMLANAERDSKFKRSVQETTRQKNTRKQKMGQATFSLKWDRDCGFEMAGV